MRRKTYLSVLTAVIFLGLAFAPAPALAQHGHGGGHPGGGGHVYVGVGVGGWAYPYWGWGPYWGWAGYWGWGGPWYGYGYPWGYYPYYPAPPDNSSSVKLEITPKDAQVYVDGYYVGVVDDFDGMFSKLHIAPGEHELVIFKQGFKTIKQTVQVRPRQDSKIKYAMQPLAAGETSEAPPPPPPPRQEEPVQRMAPPMRTAPQAQPEPSVNVEARSFGALVFRVQPAGAEILIDGERWQGPEGADRLVVQVSEGSHRIEIRKDGFAPFTTDVSVRGGETVPLNVSLPQR